MGALLWATVAAPLVAAVIVGLARRSTRLLTLAGAVAMAAPVVALVVAAAAGDTATTGFTWLPAGDGLRVGLRLDPLSAAMSAVVAGVGLVVMVYSTGYFADEPRRRSALGGLFAFLAAMQGLVLADGYLAMLIFWELVGAASARLIAFNRDDPTAVPGAVRAFLTTRTGDVGFYLAVLALFAATGSVAFTSDRPDGVLGAFVGAGFVVAAIGKSAQAPVHNWLAGAMAGPTPVSALLHSATMVAAGVYLLMRSAELLAGWPLQAAGWVGAVTAVAAAAIALAQDDLKRVLAGSTASQLGLMFVGVAAGGPVVALFHLVAHAVGKACMFLAAGLFQHERGSTALSELRGAGRADRAGFACFAIGAMSVAAVPPLAGFWSKEHVTAAAEHASIAWFVLVAIAAAGAAGYLLRPALVLWGKRTDEERAHSRGRGAMLGGAAALALAAVATAPLGGPLHRLVGGELPTSKVSLAVSLIALAAGATAVLMPLTVPHLARRAAARQLFAEELQSVVVTRPVTASANASDVIDRRVVDRAVDGTGDATVGVAHASDVIEQRGVDAAVDGLARLVGAGGRQSGRLQTGRLYEYLRDTAIGLAALTLVFALTAAL